MRYLGGQVLRRRRDALNLSRPQLAKLLLPFQVDASARTIQNWENSTTCPDVKDIAALAQVLELSLSDIFRGEGA